MVERGRGGEEHKEGRRRRGGGERERRGGGLREGRGGGEEGKRGEIRRRGEEHKEGRRGKEGRRLEREMVEVTPLSGQSVSYSGKCGKGGKAGSTETIQSGRKLAQVI